MREERMGYTKRLCFSRARRLPTGIVVICALAMAHIDVLFVYQNRWFRTCTLVRLEEEV